MVKKKRIDGGDILVITLLTLIALIIYIPFHNTLVVSFMTMRGYNNNPGALFL